MMNTRLLLAHLIFCITLSAFAQQQKNDVFELKGIIKNGNGKMIYIQYKAYNKIIRDSVKVVNGQFAFKGHISCPTVTFLENEGAKWNATSLNSISFYLEPVKMTVSLDYANFSTTIFKGSKTEEEGKRYAELTKKINTQRDSLGKLYQAYYAELGKSKDSIIKKKNQAKVNELSKISDQLEVDAVNLSLKFARENSSSFVSLYLLKTPLRLRLASYYDVNTIYNQLSPKVKNSESGIEFYQYLENYKNSIVGGLAPDFTVKDIYDKSLVLSSFRNNKYVLIDFWASWCGPCRADYPGLKNIYEKYNEKGLEIIAVSTDVKLESWKKAIEKDGIENWKHFCTAENNIPIKDMYTVTGIPVKILIDKEGVIIGRWRGGGEGNLNELNEKLKQIFENKLK